MADFRKEGRPCPIAHRGCMEMCIRDREERMVSGRGTRQSSFPKGMRRLSFSVFIRQKKSGGASGSCSGMGVSPGHRESLRLSPFRTQWRTGPRVTQVRQLSLIHI